MSGFIEGDSRNQSTLLPDCLDDYITEENPVRVVDVFLDSLNLNAVIAHEVTNDVVDRSQLANIAMKSKQVLHFLCSLIK